MYACKLRLKRIVTFDIQIFGRFLNEYPNILLRPSCLKMMDKVTYHISLNLFHYFISLYGAKTRKYTTKIQNTQQNGHCNKVYDINFVFTKNAPNCIANE